MHTNEVNSDHLVTFLAKNCYLSLDSYIFYRQIVGQLLEITFLGEQSSVATML